MPETLFEPRFIGILAVLFLAGLVSTRVLRVWRRSRLEREVDHLSETLGEHVSTPCWCMVGRAPKSGIGFSDD